MLKTDVCIIGAGFAGIGAALAAKQRGEKAIILEATNRWGGLCDNFSVDGFRFDKAVHLSFTENTLCKELFFKEPHNEHAPESMNYYEGNWVRHPVQNNLRFLPVKERINVIKSLFQLPYNKPEKIANYKKWLVLQFGEYFTEAFPMKYTRKYWGTEAEKLSCEWCGKRIHRSSLQEVLWGAFPDAPISENVYYAKRMCYPRQGGYKQFLNETAEGLDIRYGYRCIGIDASERIAFFDNGEKCKYNILISTIPLPEMINMIYQDDDDMRKAADSLQATSMALISVGFKKRIEFPSLWFYVYDENIPFARVHSPSMKSEDNVPDKCSSLQFEVYYSKEMPLKYSDRELVETVMTSMEKMNIASRNDVMALDCRHVKYANVIFYTGMEKVRDMLKREIICRGIYSCGRFGEWDYLWSDQSFLSGYMALM